MSKKTLLLVEDNPDDVELTLIAFKRSHFAHKVEIAQDGVQALDYLFGTGAYDGRDRNDIPVLVLLDLNLPKINGFEVLEKMRQDPVLKDIFVVILTSSSREEDKTRAMNLGANVYLQKAVDFDEFIMLVQRLEAFISAQKHNPELSSPLEPA